MNCPVVKVKNPAEEGGYMIINECDFVEGKHVLFDAPVPEAEDAPAKRAKPKAAE